VIHVVFERRAERLAVYGPDGHLWHVVAATGQARRDGRGGPHGPGSPIAPGHYRLIRCTELEPGTPEDGAGRIEIADLDTTAVQNLLHAGRARRRGAEVEVARLAGAVGGLALHGRSGVAIRGGGAALAAQPNPEDPLAPYQRLTPADGGVRVHNADLARLIQILASHVGAETVLFTVLGEPRHLRA
jgi:hypothetical protein